MPTFRKLTAEEVARVAGLGSRKIVELQYDSYIQDFRVGDIGEVTLQPGEKRMTIMARLKNAAARRSPALKLLFRRTGQENLLRFEVVAGEADPAPVTSVVIAEPAAKGGTRKRKVLN
jgi:hypothetical protein